ncbi:hypothetical protein [Jatrophihabitans sp.]|uniref:hypothetical protein n=1 Tax=Jatrophihabitans sp. TaxID=1932789 RepID=UPI0030C6835C|nr:hypothetical protein [Jatrophihabitans sp.]
MTSLTTRQSEGGDTRPTTFSRMFVGRPPSLAEVLAARNRALAGVVERPASPVEAPVEPAAAPTPASDAPQQPSLPPTSHATLPATLPATPPAPAASPAVVPARSGSASTQLPRSESRMHGFPRRRRTPRVHYAVPAPPTERQVERLVEQTVEQPAEQTVERTVFRDPQAATAELVVPETVPETVPENVLESALGSITESQAAADQLMTETYPASDEVARMVRGESLSPEQLMTSLLSSMHRVVVARRHHHNAVANELYRRAELIRAEAEVDAEFIRMRAYVDALSIVSAAQRSVDGSAANDSWSSSIAPLAELIAKLHQEAG